MDVLGIATNVRKIGARIIGVVTSGSDAGLVYSGATRADGIARDQTAAAINPAFRELVKRGDTERDSRNWQGAENGYGQALRLHPFHAGYRVQYAHMLKEGGDFVSAEFHYRSALAEGGRASDIEQHLAFVSRRNGQHFSGVQRIELAVPHMDAPPTAHDIEILGFLLWHEYQPSIADTIDALRTCVNNREVACWMIADRRFVDRNIQFLELLRGR